MDAPSPFLQTLPPQPSRRPHPLAIGCALLAVFLLLLAGGIAAAIWWSQRPMTPVVLSPTEKTTLDQKIQRIEAKSSKPGRSAAGSNRPAPDPVLEAQPIGTSGTTIETPYVPGSKILKISDREINGLLNMNTDMGKTVRIDFGQDAINVYLAIPIPEDSPVAAGVIVRARARLRLSIQAGGNAQAVLEDVTVFGLSLPKDWLGGIKGENLLGEAFGGKDGPPKFPGVKNLRIEPGALVLEVED